MSARVTEDEVDKRAREMRDRRLNGEAVDASTVKGVGRDKRAKWVNRRARDGERVHHFKDAGYETVKAPKIEDKGIRHAGGRVDEAGNIINGDLVLMVTSRDNYIDRLAKNKIKADSQEKAYLEARRDELNRIARTEGHAKSDVAFDDSTQEPERLARRRVPVGEDD